MSKSKNDQKILDLQKKVGEKKEALGKAQRFAPITNCSLLFEGERYNLNALDVYECMILLIRIHAYQMSYQHLKSRFPVGDKVMVSGFSLDDWEKDLMAKLTYLQRESEKKQLKQMEDKLKVLLSEDTKTELALDDIAKALD